MLLMIVILGVATTCGVLIYSSKALLFPSSSSKKKPNKTKRVSDTLIGLVNTGNTCFVNSTLQALSSCSPLFNYLNVLKIKHSDYMNKIEFPVIYTLSNLLNKLKSKVKTQTSINPTALLISLGSALKLNIYNQQDAQEFLQILCSTLYKEHKKLERMLNEEEMTLALSDLGESDTDSDETLKNHFTCLSKFVELPQFPLNGWTTSRLSCLKCANTTGFRNTEFNCLSLSVPIKTKTSLEQCFKEYIDIEYLDGVKCQRCSLIKETEMLKKSLESIKTKQKNKQQIKEKLKKITHILSLPIECDLKDEIKLHESVYTNMTKQAMISRCPKILCLHFNRSIFSSYGISKNYCEISYLETLDLTQFCTSGLYSLDPTKSLSYINNEDGKSYRKIIYKLSAVIVHQGSHYDGHFITFKKVENNNENLHSSWYMLSDENVVETRLENVLSMNPYMLFYELC